MTYRPRQTKNNMNKPGGFNAIKNLISRSGQFLIISFFLAVIPSGCSNKQMRNFNAIPPFSRNHVNVVVEIPAGTNRRIEYNQEKKLFLTRQDGESDVLIEFLPCPGNYGFVPGTFIDPVMGGDGYPVDVIVICESVPTGTVLEVLPLLVLYFDYDSGSGSLVTDPKIIAVPADERQRILKAENYEELFDNYPDLVDILVTWFLNYKGSGTMKLKAMGDGEVAVNEIRKWDIMRF
jgi:inorganic pyrophosphatase